jgi:hypothetical protein
MFSEKEDIFKAMSEIFEATADGMEKDEPNATIYIRKMMREMGSKIGDYEHFIEMNPYTVND